MKQVFVNEALEPGMKISLNTADAHHIFDVLRTSQGEKIRVVSNGKLYLACAGSKPELLILEELETGKNENGSVTVCAALVKADKFEWMLQKAAELGANRIVPFESSRTIIHIDPKKQEKKLSRWRSILEGACRQSNRTTQVILEPVCSIRDLARYKTEENFCAWEGQSLGDHLACLLENPCGDITFVIGPEGGLSEQEAKMLQSEGFVLCSLGERILRAETAVCAFLASLDFARHQLACPLRKGDCPSDENL